MPLRALLMRLAAVAAVISGIAIVAAADKPFHVDDTFFLLWARTIAPRAGEQPVVEINWERFEEPMREAVSHYAPGWPLVLSAVRRVTGDSEALLHLLPWPFATMFLMGCGLLAAVHGVPPWGVVALCAASPLFLMPATSVMADLACLGPGVLGLALWMAGARAATRLPASALLILAGQMKQSILPLFPLLVISADGRVARDAGTWLLAAAAGILAGWYPNVPPHGAGENTIVAHVLWILQWASNPGLVQLRLGYLTAALSALALFPVAWAASLALREEPDGPTVKLKAVLVGTLVLVVSAAAGFWKRSGTGLGIVLPVPGGRNALWFYVAMVAAFAWGWFALPAAVRRLPRPAAWLGLGVLGYLFGTPFPAARFLIPLLPPLAVLFVADLEASCPPRARTAALVATVAGTLWLSLSLIASDRAFARFSRDAAARGAREAAGRRLPLVTTGGWGLRWYVDRAGGRVLGRATDPLRTGAVLLEPALADHRILPHALRGRSTVVARWTAPPLPALFPAHAVPPLRASASFHGGCYWLPYAFTRGPVESMTLRVVRPLR